MNAGWQGPTQGQTPLDEAVNGLIHAASEYGRHDVICPANDACVKCEQMEADLVAARDNLLLVARAAARPPAA